MSKRSRSVIISELNALTNGELSTKVKNLEEHWLETFEKYGGEKISKFSKAIKAGDVILSDFSSDNNESILPMLKAIWNEDVKKKTSSYVIVVDGTIAKMINLITKLFKSKGFNA